MHCLQGHGCAIGSQLSHECQRLRAGAQGGQKGGGRSAGCKCQPAQGVWCRVPSPFCAPLLLLLFVIFSVVNKLVRIIGRRQQPAVMVRRRCNLLHDKGQQLGGGSSGDVTPLPRVPRIHHGANVHRDSGCCLWRRQCGTAGRLQIPAQDEALGKGIVAREEQVRNGGTRHPLPHLVHVVPDDKGDVAAHAAAQVLQHPPLNAPKAGHPLQERLALLL